ncbi:hypothetical protein P7C71_g3759, partial [Lecanoromycetidae sp. Uapishka_2]
MALGTAETDQQDQVDVIVRLQADNIIGFVDSSLDEVTPLLIMELANGGSLHSLMSSELGLSVPDVIQAFYDGLRGLRHLHAQDITHRDIKPENMLVVIQEDDSKCMKWADFGLAKRGTNLVTQCGTDVYTAPEVWNENPGYGHAADLWSFAVMIVYAKTLRFPEWPKFTRTAGSDWCNAIIKHSVAYAAEVKVRRPSHRNSNIAKVMGLVNNSLLKMDPSQRSTASRCLKEGRYGLYDPFRALVETKNGEEDDRKVDEEDDGTWISTLDNESNPPVDYNKLAAEFEEEMMKSQKKHEATEEDEMTVRYEAPKEDKSTQEDVDSEEVARILAEYAEGLEQEKLDAKSSEDDEEESDEDDEGRHDDGAQGVQGVARNANDVTQDVGGPSRMTSDPSGADHGLSEGDAPGITRKVPKEFDSPSRGSKPATKKLRTDSSTESQWSEAS